MAAEGRRAGHLDQIGNAGAVILLDQPVELDERPAEMLRQHAPERRLAGAAQTDQRDAPRRGRRCSAAPAAPRCLWRAPAIRSPALAPSRSRMAPSAAVRAPASGSSAAHGQFERLRDGAQHADRRIAGAAFDLRQIALRRLRGLRQLPARHAALGAVAPHLARRSRRGTRHLGSFAGGREDCRRFQPSLAVGLATDRSAFMHYNSCGIVHSTCSAIEQAHAAHLTRKSSASRRVCGSARLRLSSMISASGRDRRAREPAESPASASAGRPAAAGAVRRRRPHRSSPAARSAVVPARARAVARPLALAPGSTSERQPLAPARSPAPRWPCR